MSIDAPLKAALAEVEKLMLERHSKYGASNVALAPGGPLNGLRVRLYDKLARLNNYVDNGGTADFADDSLRDCFLDVIGYGVIGLLVLDGDWPDPHAQARPCPDPERVGAVRTTPRECYHYRRYGDGWWFVDPSDGVPLAFRGDTIAALDSHVGTSTHEVPT